MDSKLKWIRLPYLKLFTLNQLLGIFICLVVWIYYQWTWNCQSDVADSRNQTQTPLVRNQTSRLETIHILLAMVGDMPIKLAYPMVKSMIYFNGAMRNHGDCNRSQMCPPCYRLVRRQRNPIHMHIITDNLTKAAVDVRFRAYFSQYLQFSFYDFLRYQQNVSWIPNNHPAGTFATVKLLIPDILPESVEKVISLDCDMLFNDDIRNLWDHFSHFKHDQIIGAATEQSPESPYKSRNLTSGVNAGVLLLHLRRMRQSDWHCLWKRALSVLLADTGMLINGEQGIISEVVGINPSLYYLLPCQWNVQLWRLDGSKYCPVYWLDRLAEMQLYRERKLAKAESKLPSLVHCNKHQKPTLLGQEPIRNSNLSSTEEFLDNQKLVRRFKESFHWFRKLDRACLE